MRKIIMAVALMLMFAMPARAEVEIGIAPGEIVENPYQTIQMTDSEYNELLWVLALEAQTEGQKGEEACLEVIFNRVLSQKNNWGGSIHGVLSKRGQFSTYKLIGTSKVWAVPGEMERKAIDEVMNNGQHILPDMSYVYFDTGKKNGKRNIRIGRHWFGAE